MCKDTGLGHLTEERVNYNSVALSVTKAKKEKVADLVTK